MNDLESVPEPRRRLWLWAGVALLIAALAVPVLRTQARPLPDDPPAPTVPAPDLGRLTAPVIYDLDFADARHGFALLGRCTDGTSYHCERWLLSTRDGARWVYHTFPGAGVDAPGGMTGRVVALGPAAVLLTDLEPGDSGNRLYSADGGRSWQQVPARPTTDVATIPVGAVLEMRCAHPVRTVGSCPRRRPAAIDPGTGRSSWLRTPPPLASMTVERLPAADGSWWVSGSQRSTGAAAVAVSRDHGRTWSVATLPVGLDRPRSGIPLAVGAARPGSTVYAAVSGARPEGRFGLLAICASTDGGRTWVRTWQAADGVAPLGLGGVMAVSPDSALFIATNDVGPGYRSVDGGRTFSQDRAGPRLTWIRRTWAGYLGAPSDRSPGHYLSSPDGVHWQEVPLP